MVFRMSSAQSIELSPSIAAYVITAAPMLGTIRLASGDHTTGVLWEDSLIIVPEQNLQEQEAYPVLLAGGRMVAATTALRSADLGLVALKLVGSAPTVPLDAAAPPTPGTVLLVIGADERAEPVARLTVAAARTIRAPAVAVTAPPRFLPEGGLVLDEAGSLVGLCVVGPEGGPVVVLHSTIAQWLLPDGNRSLIGADLQPVTLSGPLRFIAGQHTGRLVLSVSPGGPAANSGVQAGDILLSIEGSCLNSPGRLRMILSQRRFGREVGVRLLREGRIKTVRLALARTATPNANATG
jgi:membrane-associated protease RseP (regulator of RpoE activity)